MAGTFERGRGPIHDKNDDSNDDGVTQADLLCEVELNKFHIRTRAIETCFIPCPTMVLGAQGG